LTVNDSADESMCAEEPRGGGLRLH